MKKEPGNASIYMVYEVLRKDPQYGLDTVKSFSEKVLGDTNKQSTASYYLSWLKGLKKELGSISFEKIDEINNAFRKYVVENSAINLPENSHEGKIIATWKRVHKIKQLTEKKNLLSEWAKIKASQISDEEDKSVVGGLSGVAAGATIGSLLGPIGTGIGALIGGLAGAGIGGIDAKTKEYAEKLVTIGPALSDEIERYQEKFLEKIHMLQQLNEQNQNDFENLKNEMEQQVKKLKLKEADENKVQEQLQIVFESIPNFENFLGLPSPKFDEAKLDVIANDLLDEIKSSKK